MTSNTGISQINPTQDISSELLMPNGQLKLLSYREYEKYSSDNLRYFCWLNARCGIPTVELVDYLKSIINGRTAIEIGSGHGDLGRYLNIPLTDSRMQEEPEIKSFYYRIGHPTIKYPEDVEKLEALEAVKKYKPQVVIASWVCPYSPHDTTYGSSPRGIEEDKLLELVDTYIMIGNLVTHGDKPIRKLKHQEINEKFIISRATNPENNRIFIWDKEK